jgi:hypothetical protein
LAGLKVKGILYVIAPNIPTMIKARRMRLGPKECIWGFDEKARRKETTRKT